jgi:hypothetical protein
LARALSFLAGSGLTVLAIGESSASGTPERWRSASATGEVSGESTAAGQTPSRGSFGTEYVL